MDQMLTCEAARIRHSPLPASLPTHQHHSALTLVCMAASWSLGAVLHELLFGGPPNIPHDCSDHVCAAPHRSRSTHPSPPPGVLRRESD